MRCVMISLQGMDMMGARFFSECEGAKCNKHVLNGATMVPLVVTTLGKLSPSALLRASCRVLLMLLVLLVL